MIPIKLTLTNFLSYSTTQTLDFSGFDLAILSGANGVGKSSLLEAITWCLWEQARAGSSDDLIHQGEQSMWVEFIFEHENGIYRVIRKRDRKTRGGTTTLEFQVAESPPGTPGVDLTMWQSLTEGTIRQTQEKIIKTLHLPYEIFVNSSYLRQGHADEFTVKLPSERKQILAEILGLSIYDQLEEKAKEHRKQAQNRLEIIKLQSEEMAKEMQDRAQIAQNAQITQAEKDKTLKIIEQLEKNQKKYQDQGKQYELINQQIELERKRYLQIAEQIKSNISDIEQLTADLKQLNILISQSDEIKKNYSQYQSAQKQLEDYNHKLAQVAELQQALAGLAQKKATVEQTIDRIKHIKNCPTCLRPMSTTESNRVIETLKKEFEKVDGPDLNKLKSEISKISYDKQRHESLRKELNTLQRVPEQYQQLLVAENSKKEKEAQFKKIQQQIARDRQEIKKIADQGLKLKTESEKLKNAFEKTQEIELKLSQTRIDAQQLEGQLGELRAKLKQIEETENKIKKWQQDIVKLQEEAAIWNELALAFSKKGIQTMIIEQTLPVIEEKANELLKRVTDGRMTVQFITQKEKKSASQRTAAEELIETLEIAITDELGTRNYEMFSGGEAFRINFGIRIALAKLLAVRSGAKLQFLVVDEGFGSLDTAGRDDIVAAINSIRDDFKKIMVVSHVPELKDAFQTRVEVTKDADGSHINILT